MDIPPCYFTSIYSSLLDTVVLSFISKKPDKILVGTDDEFFCVDFEFLNALLDCCFSLV